MVENARFSITKKKLKLIGLNMEAITINIFTTSSETEEQDSNFIELKTIRICGFRGTIRSQRLL